MKLYFVIGEQESPSGDFHSFEIGKFSTKEKAERCLNICLLEENQILYTADENGNELPVELGDLDYAKHPYTHFSIEYKEDLEVDVFELNSKTYDLSK